MLERRDDAGGLHALDVRRGDGADEVRVLADRLLHASPARVAHDVEHGREALVHAERAHVGADARAHLAHQRRVERRAPAERHRVGGRAPGREARRGTPRGRAPGCRTGSPRRSAAARASATARRRAGSTGAVPNGRVSWPSPDGQDRVEVDVVVHVVLVRARHPRRRRMRRPTRRTAARPSRRMVIAAMSASTRSSTGSAASRHGMPCGRSEVPVPDRASSLHRPGETADDALLHDEEERERRDHRERRVGEHRAGVLRVLRRELRSRRAAAATAPAACAGADDEQRQQVAVPAADEREDADGDERRASTAAAGCARRTRSWLRRRSRRPPRARRGSRGGMGRG